MLDARYWMGVRILYLAFSIQYQVVPFWGVLYPILGEKSTEKGTELATNGHEVARPQRTQRARTAKD
jgi:hypothetical protein